MGTSVIEHVSSMMGATTTAATAVLHAIFSQLTSSRQSEVPSEILCWVLLSVLLKGAGERPDHDYSCRHWTRGEPRKRLYGE